MRARSIGEVVNAHELTHCIKAENGETLAACGDWLVIRQNGERLIVDSATFKSDYEPAAGPNPYLTKP